MAGLANLSNKLTKAPLQLPILARNRLSGLRSGQTMTIENTTMPPLPLSDLDLLDALAARQGLVCLVGAGGKKTTLYRLAAAHPGQVGVTATVHISHFPLRLDAARVIDTGEELSARVQAAAAGSRVVAFACPSLKKGRLAGVNPEDLSRLHGAAGFQVIYVKADGARGRWIKAPDAHEPPIPVAATTVIPVVSARALGQPLNERIGHHPERIAAVTGAREGQLLTPEHLARLLSHPQGALKNTGAARVVPLLNMVDNGDLEALAREVARQALGMTKRFDRVVLATMASPRPLVGVVER